MLMQAKKLGRHRIEHLEEQPGRPSIESMSEHYQDLWHLRDDDEISDDAEPRDRPARNRRRVVVLEYPTLPPFDSLKSAAAWAVGDMSHLCRHLCGHEPNHQGLHFAYIDADGKPIIYDAVEKHGRGMAQSMAIYSVDERGRRDDYPSIAGASRATGVWPTAIKAALAGGTRSSGRRWFHTKEKTMSETLSDREMNNLERRILEAEKANRDVKLDRRDAWAIYEALKAAKRERDAVKA